MYTCNLSLQWQQIFWSRFENTNLISLKYAVCFDFVFLLYLLHSYFIFCWCNSTLRILCPALKRQRIYIKQWFIIALRLDKQGVTGKNYETHLKTQSLVNNTKIKLCTPENTHLQWRQRNASFYVWQILCINLFLHKRLQKSNKY